ncbi:MAG: endonuclease/exonuclease/phosphatase family protein [Spirochaetota bacterium]
MRFSLLTLNLHTLQEPDQFERLDRAARFIAEENVSCVCLQGCVQRASAPEVDDEPGLREDNAALLLRSRLEQFGLKYGLVWDLSHRVDGSFEEGSAVLSQLPLLGHCSRYVSNVDDPEDAESRNVVMARLAAAPNSVIDVYSTRLSPPEAGFEEQLGSLVTFIEETPAVLEAMKPPPPKRRGPPCERVPLQEPQVTTRLICVAGDFNVEPDAGGAAMVERGYLEASAAAREGSPQGGTSGDDRWSDYIYVKPALRPQSARVVFTGEDAPPVSDRYGVLVEFEV